MKGTKIHEYSNGGIIAKLGNKNVYMISVNDEQFAVWDLPPWSNPYPINKNEVNWEE